MACGVLLFHLGEFKASSELSNLCGILFCWGLVSVAGSSWRNGVAVDTSEVLLKILRLGRKLSSMRPCSYAWQAAAVEVSCGVA